MDTGDPMQAKTIIIGGGIAGMSCAMRLLEADKDFLLVTENLGGRIQYSAQAGVNFGAYFVMSSYTHAKKILAHTTWINPADACFHNSDTERFSLLSLHTVKRLPELLRFLVVIQKFMRHYKLYKQRCLVMPQKSALEADPYMADLFVKPAVQFIRENRIENVANDYVAKFTYACTGFGADRFTALDFLNPSQGMITPIHRLKFDPEAVAQKLGSHLAFDSITGIERLEHGFRLNSKSGTKYQAENIVIATPASVTKELLHLPEIREASRFHVFHVRAELKPVYRRYGLNLFPPTSQFMLISREDDGTYLIYALDQNIDLYRVCEKFEVLATRTWEKAMYIHGGAFMEQQYGDCLYVAGDHNGLGLEPSAISGIYAANQIINRKD
jgi:glycine/D-amino acid oxidase-like deaminating enzyme